MEVRNSRAKFKMVHSLYRHLPISADPQCIAGSVEHIRIIYSLGPT